MSLTNAKDFQTFFKLIPKANLEHVWFFPIRQDAKNPDVPKGTSLKGNTAYRMMLSDCIKRLKQGKNVGIYAVSGGLMFLDLDVKDKKVIASNSILEALDAIKTLKIRTRNGGYQYYFLNEGKYANQLIEENKENFMDDHYIELLNSTDELDKIDIIRKELNQNKDKDE